MGMRYFLGISVCKVWQFTGVNMLEKKWTFLFLGSWLYSKNYLLFGPSGVQNTNTPINATARDTLSDISLPDALSNLTSIPGKNCPCQGKRSTEVVEQYPLVQ